LVSAARMNYHTVLGGPSSNNLQIHSQTHLDSRKNDATFSSLVNSRATQDMHEAREALEKGFEPSKNLKRTASTQAFPRPPRPRRSRSI